MFGGWRKRRRLIARKISGPLDSSQPRTPVKGPVEINCLARQPLSSESASGDGKRGSVPGTAHELDRPQGHTSHPWHSLEEQEEISKDRKPELTESWGGERWCLGCGGWRNHWLTGSWCPAPPLERPEIPTPVVRVWTAADGTVDQQCAPRDLCGPPRVLRSPLPAQPQAAGAHTDLLWAPG